MPGSQPTRDVSIILPCYNEGQKLYQTLEALRDSTGVTYEVVVVNDASSDACCDFLRSAPSLFADTLLVDLDQRHGVARSRSVGAGRARAPVLVFMDAHCLPRRGWLEKLLAELEKPGTGIVAPQILSLIHI